MNELETKRGLYNIMLEAQESNMKVEILSFQAKK